MIARNLICAVVACLCLGPSQGRADSNQVSGARLQPTDSALARIADFAAPIKLKRPGAETPSLGQWLYKADVVEIGVKGYLTLTFRDGTLRKFSGPVTLSLASDPAAKQHSVVTKLASSLVAIVFTESKGEEVQLGVRSAAFDTSAVFVPRLLSPPVGAVLVTAPELLEWEPLKGVFGYAVSLFDTKHLLFTDTTRAASYDLKSAGIKLAPGSAYSWVVEALVGGSYLRSDEGSFAVLDSAEAATLLRQAIELDSAVADKRLAGLLRIQLYRDHNLKLESLREADLLLRAYPDDHAVLLTKAELLRDVGQYMDALEVLRTALIRE